MGQRASKEAAKRAVAKDPLTGFSRGAGVRTPQEEAQSSFLQRSQGGATPQAEQKPSEMPPELIKFMTDVGPLKYKEESMMKRKTRMTDSSRKTENMRLAEKIEGYETTRTTSFSTKTDQTDENEFGLDVVQLYGLLSNRSDRTNFPTEHLEHVRKAIQLPVLMEDKEDNAYIGMSTERSQQMGHRLEPLSTVRVKLVLEDLWDREATANTPSIAPK